MTNALVIASLLKKIEGVIAPETGHITTHETGAIEFSGHKVLSLLKQMVKFPLGKSGHILSNFGQMTIERSWFFQEWSICLIQQNTAPFTPKRN